MDNIGKWLEFRFLLNELESDVLLALLSELPFNSFLEEEDVLLAYIDRIFFDEDLLSELKIITETYKVAYEVADLPDKDWNEVWESNFDPVLIPGICTILAPFHKVIAIDGYRITLSPKMAFGTGHHHTTHGMIVQMSKLDFKAKEVLDFGSGTGLLAIFASLSGAKSILAIDIESPSFDNMVENFELNRINNATPILGGKEEIPKDHTFDIVLANITANVILDCLPELALCIKKEGDILFSGFYEKDLVEIEKGCQDNNLKYISHSDEGGWVVARFRKC